VIARSPGARSPGAPAERIPEWSVPAGREVPPGGWGGGRRRTRRGAVDRDGALRGRCWRRGRRGRSPFQGLRPRAVGVGPWMRRRPRRPAASTAAIGRPRGTRGLRGPRCRPGLSSRSGEGGWGDRCRMRRAPVRAPVNEPWTSRCPGLRSDRRRGGVGAGAEFRSRAGPVQASSRSGPGRGVVPPRSRSRGCFGAGRATGSGLARTRAATGPWRTSRGAGEAGASQASTSVGSRLRSGTAGRRGGRGSPRGSAAGPGDAEPTPGWYRTDTDVFQCGDAELLVAGPGMGAARRGSSGMSFSRGQVPGSVRGGRVAAGGRGEVDNLKGIRGRSARRGCRSLRTWQASSKRVMSAEPRRIPFDRPQWRPATLMITDAITRGSPRGVIPVSGSRPRSCRSASLVDHAVDAGASVPAVPGWSCWNFRTVASVPCRSCVGIRQMM